MRNCAGRRLSFFFFFRVRRTSSIKYLSFSSFSFLPFSLSLSLFLLLLRFLLGELSFSNAFRDESKRTSRIVDARGRSARTVSLCARQKIVARYESQAVHAAKNPGQKRIRASNDHSRVMDRRPIIRITRTPFENRLKGKTNNFPVYGEPCVNFINFRFLNPCNYRSISRLSGHLQNIWNIKYFGILFFVTIPRNSRKIRFTRSDYSRSSFHFLSKRAG